jgi:hypothetical protein
VKRLLIVLGWAIAWLMVGFVLMVYVPGLALAAWGVAFWGAIIGLKVRRQT